MRGQQVYLRERIPNAMFVTLSTYFYAGTRMFKYSRKDVVYTNADERRRAEQSSNSPAGANPA